MKILIAVAENDVPQSDLDTTSVPWIEVDGVDGAKDRLNNLLDFHVRTKHLQPSSPCVAEG